MSRVTWVSFFTLPGTTLNPNIKICDIDFMIFFSKKLAKLVKSTVEKHIYTKFYQFFLRKHQKLWRKKITSSKKFSKEKIIIIIIIIIISDRLIQYNEESKNEIVRSFVCGLQTWTMNIERRGIFIWCPSLKSCKKLTACNIHICVYVLKQTCLQ